MGLLTPNAIHDMTSLYTLQMRYLLSTEKQITDGLPKMIEAASDPQLKQAFQSHLQETEVHVRRLEQILSALSDEVDDKRCAVTAALISAGENIVKESDAGAVRDAGLIASAQKIEHFEIAAYGSAREWAEQLGLTQQAILLAETLHEEKHADEVLTTISARTNRAASFA